MASTSAPRQAVGRLQSLEVENFKSYKGLHVIGPFVNFTAVIGPNGSGKSNLMDAISFVCGVKTTQLRGNLDELLFCNSQSDSPEDHPTTGHVTLVFEKTDQSVLRFTRAIVPSGGSAAKPSYSSKYRINNANVTLEDFTKRLLELGVNTKARNFLVFQGDIEKTAQKSPAELCSFFEVISGSSALKDEYDRLEGQVGNADAVVSRLYQKRKQLQARKRATKAAKDEADKYNSERAELRAKKSELYLWQLFHAKKDIEECAATKSTYERKLAAVRARRDAELKKTGGSDKELARLRKQRTAVQRDLDKLRSKLADKRTPLIQAREFVNRKNRERELREKGLNERTRKKGECDKKLAGLQADLAKTREALERAEADLAAADAGDDFQLTPELREEYQALKLEAAQKTVDSARKLRLEEGALKDEESKLATESSTLAQMQAQHDRLANDIAEAEARLAEAEVRQAQLQKEEDEIKGAIQEVQARCRRANTNRVHLRQELEKADAQIQSARSEHQQSRKERKMEETVAKMVELYPNTVHGRLSDLCKISNRRHNLAVSLLMGRHMDSVVVSTRAQATTCVQYLRDTRVEPMEFIPLDTVQVTPINGRMRTLGGTAKLALDLIEYDAAIEKAMLSVFGNAIVCDTLDEAKQLGHGPENLKVISLDGTLIARDGKMSGGHSQSMLGRATRFDQKAAEKLQQARQALQAKLDALPDEQEAAREEGRLKEGAAKARMDLTACAVDRDATLHRLAQKRRELASVVAGLAAKQPDVDALQASVDAKTAEVQKLSATINRVKDHMFKDFSRKVGVANVREYEECIEQKLRDREERLSKLTRHIATLETNAEMAERQGRELDTMIHADEQELHAINETRRVLEQRKAALAAEVEGLEGQVAEAQGRLDEAKAELDKVLEDSKGAKAVEAAFDKEEAAIARDVHKTENTINAIKERAAGFLQAAELDGVDLRAAADDDDDASDDDEAEDGAMAPPELRLDYSGLSKALRRTLDADARARTEKQLAGAIAQLEEALQGAAPNLKAPEEFAAILVEEQGLNKEVDAAKAAAAQASSAFSDIRENRVQLFNEAFAHVSESIDGIYKALTRSHVNSIGGTAYMSKEDEDEPYRGGINFCAIPPNKRFRDMEQLSGGEKTLAALALLMAVHSYRPSPFFVLDEVDAALDASNLARVAHYIRQRTRVTCETPFQGIIISLKDVFYEKADALIGVSRKPRCNASAVYSFSLESFGEPQA